MAHWNANSKERWIRRDAKRRKARYGMQVDGSSVKRLQAEREAKRVDKKK